MCFPSRVEAPARTKPPREQNRERRHSGAAYPRPRCWASGVAGTRQRDPRRPRVSSRPIPRAGSPASGSWCQLGTSRSRQASASHVERCGSSQGSRGSNAYVSTTPRMLVLRTSRRDGYAGRAARVGPNFSRIADLIVTPNACSLGASASVSVTRSLDRAASTAPSRPRSSSGGRSPTWCRWLRGLAPRMVRTAFGRSERGRARLGNVLDGRHQQGVAVRVLMEQTPATHARSLLDLERRCPAVPELGQHLDRAIEDVLLSCLALCGSVPRSGVQVQSATWWPRSRPAASAVSGRISQRAD